MSRLNFLLNIKAASVFALAVCLGLWSAGFFNGYVFRFGISESFSEAEARALLGSRVTNACQPKPYSESAGEITGYSKDSFGDISVNITWENIDLEKSSRLFPTGFNIIAFKQCLKPTNPE